LDELIRRLSGQGLASVVLTNGLLLTPNLAGRLRDAGLATLVLSLYSHVAAAHDAVTGHAGAMERTVAAMRLCLAAGIPFSISTVVLPENETHFPDVIDFVFGLGARSISINSFLPHVGAPASLVEWVRAWEPRPLGEAIRRKRDSCGPGRIKTSGILPCSAQLPCPAGESFFGIDEHGAWVPCLPTAEAGGRADLGDGTEHARRGTCPLLAQTRSAELYRCD
jgi:MoaA/NifB/PqqE/SkfB family radical SAM enzyme